MGVMAERLYTRGGKEKRGMKRGPSTTVGMTREERSLHCASAKNADAPVGMTEWGWRDDRFGIWAGGGGRENLAENKKAGLIAQAGL